MQQQTKYAVVEMMMMMMKLRQTYVIEFDCCSYTTVRRHQRLYRYLAQPVSAAQIEYTEYVGNEYPA